MKLLFGGLIAFCCLGLASAIDQHDVTWEAINVACIIVNSITLGMLIQDDA